ncbi:MAG: ABC transporter ATP-binding protein [Eubacteriales bacterium]|nr:ABC transporter ATP-binding protein [Eubacteriales bacterium]
MSVAIKIENVCKKYDETVIIPKLSVEIKNSEFFTLLGPSGCGKTTLLRMIAGFNRIEAGEIKFDDTVINDIPTQKRNIGMVFQSYAIFPHLTVRQNVEYGLKIRKLPREEIRKRCDEILKITKIEEYQDRLPERLSGGQQQRVALARAIVIHPQVLLMDEPLSNLDAKLRVDMRSAIRDLQKQVEITTVYVTHDQEEALAISDRIAIMNRGEIQQVGTPIEIYTRPYNVFVATFIGHSNLLPATIKMIDGHSFLHFSSGYELEMRNLIGGLSDGEQVQVGIRPEEFSFAADGDGIHFEIANKTFLGKYVNYVLDYEGFKSNPEDATIEFSHDLGQSTQNYEVGERIVLAPNPEKINVFSEDGSRSLIQNVRQS